VTTLADSYLSASSALAASAAKVAVTKKKAKYADMPASFSFQPIAVKTLGPINKSAVDFLSELGRRISVKTNDERQPFFFKDIRSQCNNLTQSFSTTAFPRVQTSGHPCISF